MLKQLASEIYEPLKIALAFLLFGVILIFVAIKTRDAVEAPAWAYEAVERYRELAPAVYDEIVSDGVVTWGEFYRMDAIHDQAELQQARESIRLRNLRGDRKGR